MLLSPGMAMHKHTEPRRDVERAMHEASELPQPSIIDVDPEDPAQLIDDAGQFSIVDLGVEAQPSAEAEADMDAAVTIAETGEGEESEVDEDARELDTPDATNADAYVSASHDTGELYGLHTPPAEDKDLDKTRDQEGFRDYDEGEDLYETLGKKSTESGPQVEEMVDVVDDSDEHEDHRGHHKTDTRDRPVADKGSGGPGGL